MLDMVVHRHKLRAELARLIAYLCPGKKGLDTACPSAASRRLVILNLFQGPPDKSALSVRMPVDAETSSA
jgi:hypothetical protein